MPAIARQENGGASVVVHWPRVARLRVCAAGGRPWEGAGSLSVQVTTIYMDGGLRVYMHIGRIRTARAMSRTLALAVERVTTEGS